MALSMNRDTGRLLKGENNHRSMVWGAGEGKRLMERPSFRRWLIAAALSLIIASFFQFSGTKKLESADYKVGEIAPEDLFAPRDILLVDEIATESKRTFVAENTWPVFDFDSTLGGRIEQRLRAAFAEIRAFYQKEWDWNDAERKRVNYLRTARGIRNAKPLPFIPDEDYKTRKMEIRRKLSGILEGIDNKPLDISDKVWAELEKDRFSKDSENKIVTLFLQVMNEGVVLTRDNLPNESDRGITVRKLPYTGSGDEFPKGDVSSINTLSDSQKLIHDRAGDIIGKDYPTSLRNAIVDIAQQLVRPNYTFDKAQTQAEIERAKESVPDVYVQIKKGEKIFGQGEPITDGVEKKLKLLRSNTSSTPSILLLSGNFIWLLALFSMLYNFAARNIRKFAPTVKDLLHMAIHMVLLTGMLKLVVVATEGLEAEKGLKIAYLVPMMAGAMMVRLAVNSEVAIVFSVAISVISGLLAGDPVLGMYILVGSVVGAQEVGQARTRGVLAKAGVLVGAANVVVILAISLANGRFIAPPTFYNCLLGFGGGIIGGFMVLGITPVLESLFGYVTDIRLLELANQEHPLLKALIMNASGTYQHSVTVGILAEEAAKAIHVNPLLVKVASLYHDIGKMEKPGYFVENQRELGNPHDKLNPNMSSLIISSHVKYGIELARMYRMPEIIIDSISQHHGTSLMKYFYARAKEREEPELSTVEEREFRYPGPKPQTREAGIIMLADSVEATARSLIGPTPVKLRNMVRKIIGGIFNDGQLDYCELTLKDLNAISEAFINVLTSIYHSRPEYPELPAAKQDNGRKKVAGEDSRREPSPENGIEGEGANSEEDQEDTVRSRL